MTALKGKVAIVTGAGSGIGKAIAETYAKEGAKVVVSDINEKTGNEVVANIKKNGGEAIFIKANTAIPSENENLVKATVSAYGRLDIACNNAGVGGSAQLTGEYDIDEWNRVININLNGVFYGCRYQIEQMLKNGGGSIVNIASVHGMVAAPMSVAYTTAKHGVVGLTKNIAAEYAKKGIRCNAVGPGYILTPLLEDNLDSDAQAAIASKSPINRLGEPQEIADLVAFLSSDKSSFTTGAYFIADGGYTIV